MKKIIILMVASLLATAVGAQVSPDKQRDFNRKAYEVIKTYAKASQLSDYRDKAQFFELFESPDIKICNDLMGMSYEPALTVEKYAELLGDADMVNVSLKDVKKEDEIVDENGRLVMSLSFLKRMSFLSPCNTLFDSYDFFGRDYHILMTLVYDPETDECKIRELNSYGAMPVFPKDYRVLVQTDKRDNNLDINGKYFSFLLGQKLLRPDDKIFYRGARVKEKDMKDQCDHKVFATYNDKSWRVRLNGGFAVRAFDKLGSQTGSNEVKVDKGGDFSFGVDFGYIFPTTSHLRFGIFAGVGMSSNSFKLATDGIKNYSFDANDKQDIDGDEYKRYYNTGTITQKMKSNDLAVPVYVDMEYEFNSIFSVYVDAGLRFLLPMSHDVEIENSSYNTYGVYSKYGDLIIYNDINNFGENEENTLMPYEVGLSTKTTLNGIFGLGARVNVTKTIAIDAGIQYQLSGKSWSAEENKIFNYEIDWDKISADNTSGVDNTLRVDDTLNIGEDQVNLLNNAGSLKHDLLKVNVSLIFKF